LAALISFGTFGELCGGTGQNALFGEDWGSLGGLIRNIR
jgi:hypothetical protein